MASSSSSDQQQQQQQSQSQQQQQPTTVLAYPLPPIRYIESIDPNNLPTPPAPITEGVYHMFGQKISLDDAIIAPLEAHGTKRLYPRSGYDHKKELKKINASILVNFLDLIEVLVKCPDTDKRIEKCNDLATLFINFHHLINELRPHQARETLRVWLNAQRRTREDITKKLNAEMEKMTKVLDRYYEYKAANKNNAKLQTSEESSSISDLKLEAQTHSTSGPTSQGTPPIASATTPTTTAPATTLATTNASLAAAPTLDDIMCRLIDESCP